MPHSVPAPLSRVPSGLGGVRRGAQKRGRGRRSPTFAVHRLAVEAPDELLANVACGGRHQRDRLQPVRDVVRHERDGRRRARDGAGGVHGRVHPHAPHCLGGRNHRVCMLHVVARLPVGQRRRRGWLTASPKPPHQGPVHHWRASASAKGVLVPYDSVFRRGHPPHARALLSVRSPA